MKFLRFLNRKLFTVGEGSSPKHYSILMRKTVIVMLVITMIPLTFMTIINHFQYRGHLRNEVTAPIQALANKTKHSFELFLEQRLSTVRFIATAYTYEELLDEKKLNRVFTFLKKEFGGFVDIGLIDSKGDLVSYAGPYSLIGKNYSKQSFFHEVLIKGNYISNVFMGYRRFPHIVVAVHHTADDGRSWILRATIDTDRINRLIGTMEIDPVTDSFLIDRGGILQTDSRYYGKTLEKLPLEINTANLGTLVMERVDYKGRDVIIGTSGITNANFTLVIVKPSIEVLKSWYTLKTELLIVFVISAMIIVVAIFRITSILVKKLKESDEKREKVLAELQHNQKLSSIGRLAAGVAHEINNPLAIINEKAGLMNDLIAWSDDFNNKAKFGKLTGAIVQSVDRCRKITHRLLGFAKRIDVKIERININTVITEVFGFLEREALYRKIDIRLDLLESISEISSDQGQLQQVFLNLLTNAFAAVEDGGMIDVSTREGNKEGISVTISDNGIGMNEKTLQRIFDPFFSTKQGISTGLGLSITYGIVKKLGGDISVDSVVGKGSTFTVTLPEKPDMSEES